MTGLLRHARKHRGELAQNQPHSFAARFALVHYPSGAIYSFIPKNGCTTLRYSLALAHGAVAGPEDFGWVHANNLTFAAQLRDLVTAPYSFVVLRCPYARLASLFLDKFVAKAPEAWAFNRAEGDRFDLDQLTFRDFVGCLGPGPTRQANPHWRPQVDFLVYEAYSDWFRLERFAEAAQQITARTGLKVLDARGLSDHGLGGLTEEPGAGFADCPVHMLAGLRRAGRAPARAALYDPGLAADVARHYAADIALYSRHFPAADLMFEAPDTERKA